MTWPFFSQWWPVTGDAGLVKLQLSVAEVWLVTSLGLTSITGPAEVQIKKNKKRLCTLMGHLNGIS